MLRNKEIKRTRPAASCKERIKKGKEAVNIQSGESVHASLAELLAAAAATGNISYHCIY